MLFENSEAKITDGLEPQDILKHLESGPPIEGLPKTSHFTPEQIKKYWDHRKVEKAALDNIKMEKPIDYSPDNPLRVEIPVVKGEPVIKKRVVGRPLSPPPERLPSSAMLAVITEANVEHDKDIDGGVDEIEIDE